MTIEHAPRLAYTDDSHIELAPRPHVDDIAVDTLAAQQKARMAEKRAQGFNGWDDPRRCSPEKLSILMAQSMCKGKVVDVANFAAMLLARNAPAALVGEHATRAFLLGARECQAATIEALRGHLDRARSLYRAAQGEICSLLHSDAPPNKAKLGELNDYLGFALSSIDRLDVPAARGGTALPALRRQRPPGGRFRAGRQQPCLCARRRTGQGTDPGRRPACR
ncbi:hypothetical protein [Cupriavidus sp. H18C1]|uniref:hypothetical protein n=1 Tax=Cupriavidus sp. H18C1 TaxID=3241601 RepID=UPI003BB8FFDE